MKKNANLVSYKCGLICAPSSGGSGCILLWLQGIFSLLKNPIVQSSRQLCRKIKSNEQRTWRKKCGSLINAWKNACVYCIQKNYKPKCYYFVPSGCLN